MRKEWRLKKNEDFQKVFRKGQSSANRQFVLYVLKQQEAEHFRIGLSVSKKIGNAVVRNKVKRLVRQFVIENYGAIAQGNDYIVIARKPAATMEYAEVQASLQHVFKRAKVLKMNKDK